MWLLTCANQDGHSYQLTREKDHFVSRTGGDIVLSGDQSVSRKHAVFKFTSDIENSNDSVTITDLGSKYGTYINESMKLDPNKPYLLKNGDVIKFGCQWNEWRFDSKPLVVITSSVTPEVKVSLKKVISELGGELVSDWQETCSHLTTTNVLLTAKVVCALASAVPIVTPEYWTCFQEALEQKKFPPDHNDFIPPLKENVLNKNKVSFVINEKRRTIFSGKTFVFSAERHMKTYKPLISAAGGNCVTLKDCDLDDEDFFSPDIILMQHASNVEAQLMQRYNSISKLLKSKSSRPIPESEIGLAILMCSLSMYCNPQYNVVKNVLQGGSTVNLSQIKAEEVWATDTPSVVGDITNVKMEKTFEKQSVVENALSVPESSSSVSLSQHSGGQTMRICDEETLPIEMSTVKSRSTSKSGPKVKLPDIPENVASRKRIASSDLAEPSAIKVSPERISSNVELSLDSSPFEEFCFTDLQSSRKSTTSEVTIQNNEADASVVSLNESVKRKHDDNGTSPPVKQSSKRNCREAVTCVPRQNIADGSETVATTSESNHFLKAPKDQILKRDKRSASKDVKNWSSLDHHLNKRAKIVEEEELATCDGSLLRSKQSEDGEFTSKENRTSSKVMEVLADDAIPSTSKGMEGNGTSCTEKQASRKTGKKAEERRGKYIGFCFDMVVKLEDLVIETPTPPVITLDDPTNQVNFKRFKKVLPQTIQNTLPEIIGESDLVPYKEVNLS